MPIETISNETPELSKERAIEDLLDAIENNAKNLIVLNLLGKVHEADKNIKKQQVND